MKQSARWFVEISEQVFSGIGAHTNPVFNQFLEEVGGLEGRDIQFVQVAYGFDPEPIVPELFVKSTPYANPKAIALDMDGAVVRGWLKATGEGEYRLTAKGKDVVKRLLALADETFGNLEALPEADLKRITVLLHKVAERAKALPEPADKLTLSWGSRFDQGPSAPLMVQVRRRMRDLLYYRDDVHIAAWQPYGVSGQTWEAFTYIWRGDANTAAELMEKLPFRSYDEASYASVLQDLASREWIAEENAKYATTKKGNKLRQEAEEATDRYFDAPWVALNEGEIKELKGLLGKLAKAVKPPEEEPVDA